MPGWLDHCSRRVRKLARASAITRSDWSNQSQGRFSGRVARGPLELSNAAGEWGSGQTPAALRVLSADP